MIGNTRTHIVIIGGGSGSALTIRALKPFVSDYVLSAVITMSDSGSSTGELRQRFQIVPTGDLLRAILAFSVYDYDVLHTVFRANRFAVPDFEHNQYVGNLFLALLAKQTGDFVHAIRALETAVDAVGTVYPVTLEQSTLCVELSNGEIIRGEHSIDRPTYDRSIRIARAWLAAEPNGSGFNSVPQIYEEAASAVRNADYIFLGPGSLYTSIIAALCPEGMKEALAASQAKFIYIAGNAHEAAGETGPGTLSDFVFELERYLPRKIDGVVYNTHVLSDMQIKRYEDKGWRVFTQDTEKLVGYTLIGEDFEKEEGGLNAEKLGQVLIQNYGH